MRQQRHRTTVLHGIGEGLCTDNSPCPGSNMIACYLEKMSTPAERKRLESHFAACRACREDLLELRKILKSSEVKTPFEVIEAALSLETTSDPEQGTESSNDYRLILV